MPQAIPFQRSELLICGAPGRCVVLSGVIGRIDRLRPVGTAAHARHFVGLDGNR